MKIKFGLTFGLNVARLGLDETQVITASQIANRTIFNSLIVFLMFNAFEIKRYFMKYIFTI